MQDLSWFILVLFLFIVIIVLLYILVTQRVNLIQASECPKVTGSFGVTPDVSLNVINLCGQNNNEPCTTLQNTLSDAIEQCNIRNDICNSFTYDPYSGIMNIVNSTSTQVSSTGTNLYIRQVNIKNIN